jgi:hypothetical protein
MAAGSGTQTVIPFPAGPIFHQLILTARFGAWFLRRLSVVACPHSQSCKLRIQGCYCLSGGLDMRTGTLRAGTGRFQPRLESLTRVRIHAGEPDNRVRTFSARYLTANSHWPYTSSPIWPLLATVLPSPLPGACGTRLSKRQDTGSDGRSSPFRVFDLPVSSRVALIVGARRRRSFGNILPPLRTQRKGEPSARPE